MNKTHGMTGTRIYRIWAGMRNRCNYKNIPIYKYYGGRGITYDKKWEKFEGFYEDMKEGYLDNLEIDRIDNDGNYCKENCRWSTRKEQNRNYSRNIVYKGKCLIEWSEVLNIHYKKICKLYHNNLLNKAVRQSIKDLETDNK